MPCLALLPSLICGLAVSIEDVRHRRVPRTWIIVGCLCQMGANVIYGLAGNELYVVPQSLLFAVVAAVLQCLLALARPGSLGFGDVTCTLMIGLCVGAFGLTAMLGWWVLMGIIGLVWMTLWLRFDPQSQSSHAGKVPFAPVIVSAGLIAAAMALMM